MIISACYVPIFCMRVVVAMLAAFYSKARSLGMIYREMNGKWVKLIDCFQSLFRHEMKTLTCVW